MAWASHPCARGARDACIRSNIAVPHRTKDQQLIGRRGDVPAGIIEAVTASVVEGTAPGTKNAILAGTGGRERPSGTG